jgi:hypothetical protein
MFIAFEGPDNVGKSTSAKELDSYDEPSYNITKGVHDRYRELMEPSLVHTYDRIDWFSHMVYRLALPDREWNDERVRTVFAMPDTHLVIKLHSTETADFTADEVVDTPIVQVNPVYWLFADSLIRLNAFKDYALFKSISIMEVVNTPEGYSQKLVVHDNPNLSYVTADVDTLGRMVTNNNDLLAFLQDVEQRTL